MHRVEQEARQILQMYPEVYESSDLTLTVVNIAIKYKKCVSVLKRHGTDVTNINYFSSPDEIGVMYMYLKYEITSLITEIQKVISNQNEETK